MSANKKFISDGDLVRDAAAHLWDGIGVHDRFTSGAIGICNALFRAEVAIASRKYFYSSRAYARLTRFFHALPYSEYRAYLQFESTPELQERQAIRFMLVHFIAMMWDDEDAEEEQAIANAQKQHRETIEHAALTAPGAEK